MGWNHQPDSLLYKVPSRKVHFGQLFGEIVLRRSLTRWHKVCNLTMACRSGSNTGMIFLIFRVLSHRSGPHQETVYQYIPIQSRPSILPIHSDSNIDSPLHHHFLSTVPHWMVTLNKRLLKQAQEILSACFWIGNGSRARLRGCTHRAPSMAPHVILFARSARTPSCSTMWESWTAAKATRRPGLVECKMQTQTLKTAYSRTHWANDPKTHDTHASEKPFGGQEGSVCSNSSRLVGLEITLHLLGNVLWLLVILWWSYVLFPTQVICGSPWGKFSTPGDCELCKRRHMSFFVFEGQTHGRDFTKYRTARWSQGIDRKEKGCQCIQGGHRLCWTCMCLWGIFWQLNSFVLNPLPFNWQKYASATG